VSVLRRYPVKSMLGEELASAVLGGGGVDGDRVLALIDRADGHVVSAKRPALWRKMLQCTAGWDGASVRITLPDGSTVGDADHDLDRTLSGVLGRAVHLADARPDSATLARPAPEDVMESGDDVEVDFELLEIGQGTTGSTFVDYAPVHLITTATVDHLGTEHVRYRPNVLIATPDGEPFAENEWVGRELTIGGVRLRGILPTPRCAIPTLEHGRLPRSPQSVRSLLDQNRIDVPGFGVLPCAGLYAEVLEGGTIHGGDPVRLA
jgi:uncharacterized protein YcbX